MITAPHIVAFLLFILTGLCTFGVAMHVAGEVKLTYYVLAMLLFASLVAATVAVGLVS